MPNRLLQENSLYLRQHAHNPVEWYPWCDAAWEKARTENKLVLVSIGYSACHWCHVMERESFENEATARIMNERFVCIKVDREERPDVDQLYMSAVQLMTGGGGWPLNCFTLPDRRPIYGGTYFPNPVWNDLLLKLDTFFKEEPERADRYAAELTDGIRRMESFHGSVADPQFTVDTADELVANWSKLFDTVDGGPNRAPKFPLPNNYEFLLHYGVVRGNEQVLGHVRTTLEKMAGGGIYDHVGGGFARYSVDSFWKVPHFEKMLYDNAQLVALYSNAWKWSPDPLYREVVSETIGFIRREMTDPSGLCYSALDADSEGVEGQYYTWTRNELAAVKWPEYKNVDVRRLAETYFSFDERGHWEHGRYIPLRSEPLNEIAQRFSLEPEAVREIISSCKAVLLKIREQRIRPGLDDKLLLSWNALMISGYCHAFMAFGDNEFLQAALAAAVATEQHFRREDGRYVHCISPGKKPTPDAPLFLEDLANYGEALTLLYECTLDESFLHRAKTITELMRQEYLDTDTSLLWFTAGDGPELVARKREVQDNVLPASNSVAAKLFFRLGHYFNDPELRELASGMLQTVQPELTRYGSAYSNWSRLLLWHTLPFHEVVLTGPSTPHFLSELQRKYLPDVLLAGTVGGTSEIPLCENRWSEGKSLIHCCRYGTCSLPVASVAAALQQLKPAAV